MFRVLPGMAGQIKVFKESTDDTACTNAKEAAWKTRQVETNPGDGGRKCQVGKSLETIFNADVVRQHTSDAALKTAATEVCNKVYAGSKKQAFREDCLKATDEKSDLN